MPLLIVTGLLMIQIALHVSITITIFLLGFTERFLAQQKVQPSVGWRAKLIKLREFLITLHPPLNFKRLTKIPKVVQPKSPPSPTLDPSLVMTHYSRSVTGYNALSSSINQILCNLFQCRLKLMNALNILNFHKSIGADYLLKAWGSYLGNLSTYLQIISTNIEIYTPLFIQQRHSRANILGN